VPVAFLASILFGYLAVRQVNLDELRDAFEQAHLWWLVPALAALAAAVTLRAVRWRLLFDRKRRPTFAMSLRALLIGYFFDSVVFARSGDAARIVYLNQRGRVSKMESLGVTVAERLYDMVALLLIIPIAAPFFPKTGWLGHVALIAALLASIGIVLAVAAAIAPARAERVIRRLPGRTPEHLGTGLVNLAIGLRNAARGIRLVPMLLLSGAIWLATATSFWCCLTAFNLGLGLDAGLFVLIAVSLAIMIPSLPAALGVFEGAVVLALRAYGVDDSTAFSCAVAMHAVNVLPFVAIGLVLLHGHVRSIAGGMGTTEAAPPNQV
jgi:uncharacterized protein (TIRG00374 family)